MSTTENRAIGIARRLGRHGGVVVGLSIVACYGTLALVAALSLLGIGVDVHEGAWAAAIVVLAWLAVVAIAANFPAHRGAGPAIMAGLGALLVSWVMFVTFLRMVEILGFAFLVAAALWDRRLRREQGSARR